MGRKVEDNERNAEVGQRDVTERGEPRALLESTRSGVTYRVRLKQTLRFNHKAGARDANWGNWEHEKYTNSNVCDCVNTRAAPKWDGVRKLHVTPRSHSSVLALNYPHYRSFFPASHFSCQHKHGETRSRARALPPKRLAEARGRLQSSGQDYSIMPTGPLFRLNRKNKRDSLWRVQEARLRASVSSIPPGLHRGCRVPVKPPHIY